MQYSSKRNICLPAIIFISLVAPLFAFSQTNHHTPSEPGISKLYEAQAIDSLKQMADIHLVSGRLDLAETELLEVLQRLKAIRYPHLHFTYDLLAVTYRYKGDFSKGLFYALKTIESVEATHDTAANMTFYSRLANMYRELGQPEKSVEWYKKLFKYRDSGVRDSFNLYMMRDAGFLVRELMKLKKEKEALAFMLDVKDRNKPADVHAAASQLASMAYFYHTTKQDRLAERYYHELISLAGQLKNDNEVNTDVHREIGQYFMDKREYGAAADYFRKALNATAGTNSLSETKDIYLMLYRADSAMGNYLSAIQHLMKHKLLNDAIFNETQSRQIEELQVQYEAIQKEKHIEVLNNQNLLERIRAEQANRTKNITLSGIILLLTIIGLLLNRYTIKQRSTRKLEIHQRELNQKNDFLETLNTEQNKLLKEKEWLIKEVHHRVKNNLQMVTSLLNIQSTYLENDTAVVAVKDSLRRMQAMSLIHQKLYQSDSISTIDIPEYINELVGYLLQSFDTGKRITFEQTIAPLYLDISQAIPLGLIINESVVNAIKYAFPGRKKGTVRIRLQREETGHLMLAISDNGVGLPTGFDIMDNDSLGLDLIKGLARQLHGSFLIESDEGVHIMIRFMAISPNHKRGYTN